MHRLLAVLLLTTACASSPERYDYDGPTPRPPSTTYTPTGAGAPAVGQPGAIDPDRATLPRGKDKRILMGRPDGQPVMAASDGDARRALILRVKRPVPSPPDGISREAWRKCWDDVVGLLLGNEAALGLTEAEMECLRNTLLGECGQWLTGLADKYREEGGHRDFFRRYFPANEWNSRDFEEALVGNRNAKRCEGRGAYTPRVRALIGELGDVGRDELNWRNP